jgi:dTDP-4-amino-4,6-dideoxygalactose transaminase
LASAIGPNTKAVIAVHLYGLPAALDAIQALCARSGIALIEDAAQAFGSEYRGNKVGTLGDLGCLSFHPSKVLGAFGDGGAVVTSQPELARKLSALRVHGATAKYRHTLALGGNHRLDALQAAVLSVKLRRVEEWIVRRADLAKVYDEGLSDLEGVVRPSRLPGVRENHALYTLRIRDGRRDALQRALAESEIETAVHYPLPIHFQPALLGLVHFQPALLGLGLVTGGFPNAERAAQEVLSLPLYPELPSESQKFVIDRLRQFFSGAR